MAADAYASLTRSRRAGALGGIYVILNERPRVLETARAVLRGGVRVLQYRAKDGIVPQTLRALRELATTYAALLIVNDDWRAVAPFDCDGVHLGPDDSGFADVAEIRLALPHALIGLSCGTAEEIARANGAGVDYAGVGSVFATTSKADAGAPIGVAGLRALAAQSALPVAAIGGITVANLRSVRDAGVAMAAVISAVGDAGNPQEAAEQLIAAWEGASEPATP